MAIKSNSGGREQTTKRRSRIRRVLCDHSHALIKFLPAATAAANDEDEDMCVRVCSFKLAPDGIKMLRNWRCCCREKWYRTEGVERKNSQMRGKVAQLESICEKEREDGTHTATIRKGSSMCVGEEKCFQVPCRTCGGWDFLLFQLLARPPSRY